MVFYGVKLSMVEYNFVRGSNDDMFEEYYWGNNKGKEKLYYEIK